MDSGKKPKIGKIVRDELQGEPQIFSKMHDYHTKYIDKKGIILRAVTQAEITEARSIPLDRLDDLIQEVESCMFNLSSGCECGETNHA